MIEVIVEEVARLTGKTPAEIAEAHKEGDDWKEGTPKALLNEIGGYWKGNLEDQRKRGQKDAHKQWRSALKGNLEVEIQDPSEVPNVVEQLQAKYTKEIKVPIELDPEAALEDPKIKEIVNQRVTDELAAKLEPKVSEWQAQIDEANNKANSIRAEYEQKGLMNEVYGTIDRVLMNPDNKVKLGDKPEEKDSKVKYYKNRTITPSMFGRDAEGKPIPIDDKGEPLRDPDTYKPITLEQFVLKDQPFGFYSQDINTSSPSVTTQTTTGPTITGTPESLREQIKDAKVKKDYVLAGKLTDALIKLQEKAS